MNVYEVTLRHTGAKFLRLEDWVYARERVYPVRHLDPDYSWVPYEGPHVFLVNDRNERDYYGSLQLVSVHQTYRGAEMEMERIKRDHPAYCDSSSACADLELDVDYLKD